VTPGRGKKQSRPKALFDLTIFHFPSKHSRFILKSCPKEWLRDYFASYLQRDLSDLGRLNDLEPFVRAQQAIALRTSKPINFTELGRLAGVSSPTAKKFMRYLKLSYQATLIPAFSRNPEKRLAKQPKVVFLDPGVRRGILRKSGVWVNCLFQFHLINLFPKSENEGFSG
jgi:predicted AAA+ superfamily ATPase